MRIPAEEFVPAQLGATGDTMILHNMAQGSKGSGIKGRWILLVLIVLAGLSLLAEVLFTSPAAFDRVESSFVLYVIDEAYPEQVRISDMEACYQGGVYYYTVMFRVGDDSHVNHRVYYGKNGAEGVLEAELYAGYYSAMDGETKKVYTRNEIDSLLAACYDEIGWQK